MRLLNANEIECRVGTATNKGFSLLLYKNARVDMQILDETFGATNWQREHKEIKGNLYCGISIWDTEKNQWITKWDCGVESNTEKEKGESSDSFKRAGFNWGIGRELYTSPFIWIKDSVIEKNGKYVPMFRNIEVANISFNKDREIDGLVIVGDGEKIFEFGTCKNPLAGKVIKQDDVKKAVVTGKSVEEIVNKEMTLAEALEVVTPKGTKLKDLQDADLQYLIDRNTRFKKAAQIVLDDRNNGFTEDTDTSWQDDERLPF